jgi:CBS-domain-containing membrane protein
MVDSGTHRLLTKGGDIHRMSLALTHEFLVVTIPERLRRADLRTPRLEVLAGAVVAKVALLHQPRLHIKLGHPKGVSLGLTAGLMVLLKSPHPPAGATTLIISLGLLTKPWQLVLLMIAVILLTLQAIAINRAAGIPYPLWNPVREPTEGGVNAKDTGVHNR